ncbi:30S ribosomal protein S16 [Candidatus Uhrbacteria bacterium CG_4_9_14_0_2_um_filter_41_50]|uniref:Small ribosomal subunit protein bS16 n=1 Tax=Candidatus Uhrbacteria bacterium CG_4_9_14_0_2_um_filter_41_50 TaxID=1975031 RepID=A0A2M8EQ52_9BACT|nr:MAG: 30S ribosomal protein S16 [Candidatus Uhrbacteria bacterium CG_4_10_14_3_um_filter_41_21]PIZ54691.1 MAG: 30S ribosomal protein S16 [Candidatus Uhrbacteria bacterium CG_4_10_14_0_2_um_filter_41_21]PJB84750.1 MAG: 30S ribosomal protein S16 [Candidatus Uhrbacteria bacterium CG_4_9_14_0_8_um_filter_41_16]PJC24852.1 MAG: 30S ribosomal protein S16 [Candidatus Uhrbacteria bacterium CG_4_9_14_0_2_um_filter_41_50]PJE75252.1 MAG: 30S ribosomal protein S16 [Candidatus Uhrbacteria bacterium CG10_bi
MLTIRLSRTGKKKAPSYRIVLQENHRDPWSPAIEVLGTYNPRAEKDGIVLKEDRIKYWLKHGVQPSNTVHNLFVDAKLMEGEKLSSVTITKRRSAKLGEKVAAEKAKAEETKAKAAEAKAKEAEKKAAAKVAAKEEQAAQEAAAKAPAEETTPVAEPAVEEAPAEESVPEEKAEESAKETNKSE